MSELRSKEWECFRFPDSDKCILFFHNREIGRTTKIEVKGGSLVAEAITKLLQAVDAEVSE